MTNASGNRVHVVGRGVGVAVTIALAVACGGPGGGAATPAQLATAALDALAHDDERALRDLSVARAGLAEFVMRCKDDDAMASVQRSTTDHIREDITRRLIEWRGLSATVVSIEEGEPHVVERGEVIDDGDCVLKVAVTRQSFEVTAHVHYKGEPRRDHDEAVYFAAEQVDGQWFLRTVPSAPRDRGELRMVRLRL